MFKFTAKLQEIYGIIKNLLFNCIKNKNTAILVLKFKDLIMNRRVFILILLDIVFIVISFYISTLLKGVNFKGYFLNYLYGLGFFGGIWITTSLIYSKYIFIEYSSIKVTSNILKSNLIAFAVVTSLIFFTRQDYF